MNGWRRFARKVGLSDPTYVVTWEHKDGMISIMEFQGIYSTTEFTQGPVIDRMNQLGQFLGKELHQALEQEFEAKQEEFWASQAKAGYPDSEIYGEA